MGDGTLGGGGGTGAPERRPPRHRALAALVGFVAVTAVLGTACAEDAQVRSGDDRPDATSTSTPATTAPATDARLGLAVTAEGTTRSVTVDVNDGAAPVAAGSRQCAYVRVSAADGALATEGSACTLDADGNAPDLTRRPDGALVVPLAAANGTEIGPACTAVPAPGGEPSSTARAQASFRFELPADLPTGDYRVEVTATSGVGDGCATEGEDSSGGWEHATTSQADLTVG